MAKAHKRLRPPRVAEIVADRLRSRIVNGELGDDDMLPKEEELRAEFGVSKPSMREALWILEAEGLLTVQRGNVGGAVVHTPSSGNAAYVLGLVLRARQSTMGEVARALRELEPVCAALCAGRDDRATTVVPQLRAIQASSEESVHDRVEVVRLSRRFHETIVAECDNEPLIVVVGALEALWSGFETSWAERIAREEDFPEVDERRSALADHARLIDLIEAGDTAGTRAMVAQHLVRSQDYPRPSDASDGIDLAALRARTIG